MLRKLALRKMNNFYWPFFGKIKRQSGKKYWFVNYCKKDIKTCDLIKHTLSAMFKETFTLITAHV